MRILINEHQLHRLIKRNVILEYKIFPYQEDDKRDNYIKYNFDVEGLMYRVQFAMLDPETFELGFNVDGAEDSTHRVGKNLTHLNSVLNTIDSIVKEVVNKYRIKKIIFSGARENADSENTYVDPLRLKIYFRYLTQKYPNAKFDKDRNGNLIVYLNSVYPEIFEEKMDKKEIFLSILKDINGGEDEDYWIWDQSFVIDEFGEINGNTDSIVNDDYGSIYIELGYDQGYKNYDLKLVFLDNDDEKSKTFKNFEGVTNYLKKIFL